MFFDAQRKFETQQEQWRSGPTGSYVAQLMRQYGDRGKSVFRERADPEFQRALEFREREKAHYKSLERKLTDTERKLAHVESQFGRAVKILEKKKAASDARRRDRERRDRDSRDGSSVVPSVQTHAGPREEEKTVTFSEVESTTENDGSPSTRGGTDRSSVRSGESETDIHEQEGRASDGAPNDAVDDNDRSTEEHDLPERGGVD